MRQLHGQQVFEKFENQSALQDYDENTFTFKHLLLKLTFEQMIDDFQYSQNFELVYEFIKEYGPFIENVSIKMIEKRALKSNHYWLLAFIPKLKHLKQLTMFSEDTDCNADGYKFLTKAMSYF